VSLCALTLCCGIKIVRVIRVESWEVFPKHLRNGLEYCDKTLHGRADAGSEEFVTFHIDAAWEMGTVYGFLLSLHTVDFVLALHASAKRM